MLLGCIADDFTGATDLALTLSRSGMRVVQTIGVPASVADIPDCEAVVVALKSRTIPAGEAVAQSLASLEVLLAAGAEQIFFKYCSTFDSTDDGNIGPVTEALMQRLGCDFTIACPAFPTNGRTIFKGHLFVGDQLLSDSPMQHHPLTPMTDANLVSVLGRQMSGRVGLVAYDAVDAGAAKIAARFAELKAGGVAVAITDAISDRHLTETGQALDGMKLVTGGSGIAMGLPENFRRRGLLASGTASAFSPPEGRAVYIAGSCSQATRRQIEVVQEAGIPSRRVDPFRVADGSETAATVTDWVLSNGGADPVLIYSSADPAEVGRAQEAFGRDKAGALIEDLLAEVARGLVDAGISRLVVAGGETSGAVVSALKVKSLQIGPEIDPGVPWTLSMGKPGVALALKSGNFGAEDFFTKASGMLDR
ncbi:MAG: four-carbon acid sugar kinase family protein [Rhodospirillales bacterium]